MNIFDCHFLSNLPYRENFDHLEMSNRPSESSASAQEMNSCPYACNILNNNGERLQRAIYKGPDVFGKVLGPTADESILVGLQALMDMAGGLECTDFTSSSSSHETPMESSMKESQKVSERVNQISESCQCSVEPETSRFSESLPGELHHEVVNGIGKKPYRYIITHENIEATVNPRRKKCQHSQTRVLPASMTCYDPNRCEFLCDGSCSNLPCPNSASPKPTSNCPLRRVCPPTRRRRPFSSPESGLAPNSDCPCSQFYHQKTTISVLTNRPGECSSCLPTNRSPLEEEQTNILFRNGNQAMDDTSSVYHEKHSLVSEPTKETNTITIQTKPIARPMMSNAKVDTEAVESLEKSCETCGCNCCVPISAGVSTPPSVTSNVGKTRSTVRFADEAGMGSLYSVCNDSKEKTSKKPKNAPVRRNKSCSCSLIQKDVKVADAAISCLKVNTSCQYFGTEILGIESRSTQCYAKLNGGRDSCSQICSESGDCQPHRRKSVKILEGPYEYHNITESRYCVEPDKSINNAVLPLLDSNDVISYMYFDKPPKDNLEMGDSFIPAPMEVRYAITKITKFPDFSTFEVMKSTSKKPKCLPKAVEGVFVLKKEDSYISPNMYE